MKYIEKLTIIFRLRHEQCVKYWKILLIVRLCSFVSIIVQISTHSFSFKEAIKYSWLEKKKIKIIKIQPVSVVGHKSHVTSCALKTFLSEKSTSFHTTSTPSSVSMAREALSTPGTLPWLTCRGQTETHTGLSTATTKSEVYTTKMTLNLHWMIVLDTLGQQEHTVITTLTYWQ